MVEKVPVIASLEVKSCSIRPREKDLGVIHQYTARIIPLSRRSSRASVRQPYLNGLVGQVLSFPDPLNPENTG